MNKTFRPALPNQYRRLDKKQACRVYGCYKSFSFVFNIGLSEIILVNDASIFGLVKITKCQLLLTSFRLYDRTQRYARPKSRLIELQATFTPKSVIMVTSVKYSTNKHTSCTVVKVCNTFYFRCVLFYQGCIQNQVQKNK